MNHRLNRASWMRGLGGAAFACCVGCTLVACSGDSQRLVVGRNGPPQAGTGSPGPAAGPGTLPAAAGGQAPGMMSGPRPPASAGTLGAAGAPIAMPRANAPIAQPTPVLIDRTGAGNPAGLSEADVTKLIAGGPLGDMKWLYPYDQTVFPRGTRAPLVMWNGADAADSVYLHIRSQLFEYKGVLKTELLEKPVTTLVSSINDVSTSHFNKVHWTGKQVQIPQDVWELAGQKSLGKGDAFLLELSERANGQVRGLISSRLYIAQGDIKGSVYYSSCSSTMEQASSLTGGNGRVLRIPPGGTAQSILSGNAQGNHCQGCHSVSADGSRLIAQQNGDLSDLLGLQSVAGGLSYQLGSDGSAEPIAGNSVGPNAAYGALYPDGSKFLSTAMPALISDLSDPGYSLPFVGNIAVWGGVQWSATMARPATLYDAASGAITPDTGVPAGALMPMFSPDGRRLSFSDAAVDHGRALVAMDYDTRNHKASNYQILMQEPADTRLRPAWPAFLPDNRAVVFVRTDSRGFFGFGARADGTIPQPSASDPFPAYTPSDLHVVDVASGKVTLLAKAMGFDSETDAQHGKSYLSDPIELHHNYFPTVSQVASGGHFWIFFDTLRHYGNLGITRGIWGFALDVSPNGYTADLSHPPFYLPGQEFNVGNNHRAFVALDPCKEQGASCTSPTNCCAGLTCIVENAAETQRGLEVGTCAPPPPDTTCTADCKHCAKRDERCSSDSDCCDPNDLCINSFCAYVELL